MGKLDTIIDNEEIEKRIKHYVDRIWPQFRISEIPLNKKTERVPSDLQDIAWFCIVYLSKLDVLLSEQAREDRELFVEILNELWGDIYIHLEYHQKGLKKPLIDLIDQLEHHQNK